MSRWHEPTCIRPSVAVVGGLPCCSWCHAVASIDDITFAPPLVPSNQSHLDDDDNNYQLRWPKCVEYKDEDESISGQPAFMPSAAATDDHGETDAARGDPSSSHSPTNKVNDLEEVGRTRSDPKNDPYQPSRCYPVFWANKEIRLLQLDSARSSSLLHGAFSRVQVDSEQAQYEAISYTWADESGDSTRCRPMFIGPFWDIIPITRNCENALRSVRISGGPPRSIWIDSLCINQDDDKERSAQVALMPRIYAGAAGVLVYLGNTTWDSDLAMDAITRSEDSYRCSHLGTRSGICEGCFKAVERLFQRTFFERLWVVQEVTLARSLTIFCGSRSTYWPPHHVTDHLPISLWTKSHKQREDEPGFELLGLMTDTSKCVCTDIRDRVFALLGMLHGLKEGSITADYSLSPQKVGIGIAAFLVQKCGRGREILLYAGLNRAKRRRLPSWVPDFVEPLIPDWKMKGLLDRSRVISGDSTSASRPNVVLIRDLENGVRRNRLSLPSFHPTTIQVHARTAALCLPAVKLCNLTSSFQPYGSRHYFKPFVRHESTRRAVVVVPKAPTGSKDSSSWLRIIMKGDGLYWLHGIEGFAILRPNDDQESHSLVCGCDVYFEKENPWGASSSVRTQPPDPDWSTLLQPFSPFDGVICSERLKLLLLKASIAFGNAEVPGEQTFDTKPAELLLDIAVLLRYSPRKAATAMWKSWQDFEKRLLPLFQCDEGLGRIRKAFEDVVVLRCGTEIDGRPKEVYAFQDCYVQSFEAIASLVWSLIPSATAHFDDRNEVVLPEISSAQILKDLKDWADLTKSLFALNGPLSDPRTSQMLSYFFPDVQEQWDIMLSSSQDSLQGVEPLIVAQHMLSLFSEPRIADTRNISEPALSLVSRAYTKARRKQLLWDWKLFESNMEKREVFLKVMENDAWLTSWRLHDEQERLEKDALEMQQAEMSRLRCPASRQPDPQRPYILERKLSELWWLWHLISSRPEPEISRILARQLAEMPQLWELISSEPEPHRSHILEQQLAEMSKLWVPLIKRPESQRFHTPEQLAEMSRLWGQFSSRRESYRSHPLERQLALRLLLRGFHLNVDSHTNVEIR